MLNKDSKTADPKDPLPSKDQILSGEAHKTPSTPATTVIPKKQEPKDPKVGSPKTIEINDTN